MYGPLTRRKRCRAELSPRSAQHGAESRLVMAGSMAITFSPGPEKTYFSQTWKWRRERFRSREPEMGRLGLRSARPSGRRAGQGDQLHLGPNDEKFANRLTLWIDANSAPNWLTVVGREPASPRSTRVYARLEGRRQAFELVPRPTTPRNSSRHGGENQAAMSSSSRSTSNPARARARK
jgi:hypothetical protein